MLCTGQVPNTAPLRTLNESIVRPDSGLACVLRTMQVASCGQEGDYLLEPVLETEPEDEVEQDVDEVDETEAEAEVEAMTMCVVDYSAPLPVPFGSAPL